MRDAGKLTNVKRCMSLLLKFMTPADELSVVSFGENSSVLLNRVKAEATAIPMMEQAIDALCTDGCTNLSAGLGSIREILDSGASSLKNGLLILTDGHANRGAHMPNELQAIVKRICELYPALSFSFIAYGTDHNAELMKLLTEETNGKYSIVENLEGAALSMGDALGGIISCVAQNVVVEVPEGTVVEGPFKIVQGRLTLGDLYAGCEKLILLSKPEGPVRVRGVSLPLLDPFNTEVVSISLDRGRNTEIELTRLRYICAQLFRDLRAGINIHARLESFRAALADSFLDGNAITDMLRAELVSIDNALAEITMNNRVPSHLFAQLTQHEMFSSTGGGTAHPITPHVHWEDSNTDPAPAQLNLNDTQSPLISTTQRNIASLMRSASLTPQV